MLPPAPTTAGSSTFAVLSTTAPGAVSCLMVTVTPLAPASAVAGGGAVAPVDRCAVIRGQLGAARIGEGGDRAARERRPFDGLDLQAGAGDRRVGNRRRAGEVGVQDVVVVDDDGHRVGAFLG